MFVHVLLFALLLRVPLPEPGTMVRVPAGRFLFGSNDGDADEHPLREATTGAFLIDRTEVSRGDYERCVASGACSPAARYDGQTESLLPQTGVSFFDAVRYCHAVKKRLPTEREWEKAARGSDGRRFPWGSTADCQRANYGAWAGEGPCGEIHPGRPEPIGRYPGGSSPYGALDMAGNVWEWVDSIYPGERGPGEPPRRTLKGGSCCSTFLDPRSANRVGYDPAYRDADVGFRCARSASEAHTP
jgi:formylglycine-generating enzyme required for sulfatase activity